MKKINEKFLQAIKKEDAVIKYPTEGAPKEVFDEKDKNLISPYTVTKITASGIELSTAIIIANGPSGISKTTKLRAELLDGKWWYQELDDESAFLHFQKL